MSDWLSQRLARAPRDALRYGPAAALMAALLAFWQVATLLWRIEPWLLPAPTDIARAGVAARGLLGPHVAQTALQTALGFTLALVVGLSLGLLIDMLPAVRDALYPLLVVSQTIPIIVIAPLLVIWFGPGIFSKVLICALIVFFPVLVNTIVGFQSVPENLRDLMRSMRATRWQTLRQLELPAALPVLLGGLRVGATLSVIGAVVGELVGADRGLGFLINVGRGQYDTALVFVGVFTLVFVALALYGSVLALENHLLRWKGE